MFLYAEILFLLLSLIIYKLTKGLNIVSFTELLMIVNSLSSAGHNIELVHRLVVDKQPPAR